MTVSGFIGVVHLPAMPGDPRYERGGFEGVYDFALRDAEALASGGVDGIIVENFGSAPFWKGDHTSRIPPHQVALMTRVVGELVKRLSVPVGVNCLRNDVHSALGIAAATGAAFVRVNVHTGAYFTDQGVIEGEAAESLRYRAAIGGTDVKILADVLVKHAAPMAPLNISDAVKDTLHRGGADGVIVTGNATGGPVDEDELALAAVAAGEGALFVGSGLDPTRAQALAPGLTGALVGTWLKEQGALVAPVDAGRVRTFADAVRGRWGRPGIG